MPATVLNINLGDPLRMAIANAEKGLPLQQRVGELPQGLVALPSYLSVRFWLQNIIRPSELFYFGLMDKRMSIRDVFLYVCQYVKDIFIGILFDVSHLHALYVPKRFPDAGRESKMQWE